MPDFPIYFSQCLSRHIQPVTVMRRMQRHQKKQQNFSWRLVFGQRQTSENARRGKRGGKAAEENTSPVSWPHMCGQPVAKWWIKGQRTGLVIDTSKVRQNWQPGSEPASQPKAAISRRSHKLRRAEERFGVKVAKRHEIRPIWEALLADNRDADEAPNRSKTLGWEMDILQQFSN